MRRSRSTFCGVSLYFTTPVLNSESRNCNTMFNYVKRKTYNIYYMYTYTNTNILCNIGTKKVR